MVMQSECGVIAIVEPPLPNIAYPARYGAHNANS
jgi:hypothetical protein